MGKIYAYVYKTFFLAALCLPITNLVAQEKDIKKAPVVNNQVVSIIVCKPETCIEPVPPPKPPKKPDS